VERERLVSDKARCERIKSEDVALLEERCTGVTRRTLDVSGGALHKVSRTLDEQRAKPQSMRVCS